MLMDSSAITTRLTPAFLHRDSDRTNLFGKLTGGTLACWSILMVVSCSLLPGCSLLSHLSHRLFFTAKAGLLIT